MLYNFVISKNYAIYEDLLKLKIIPTKHKKTKKNCKIKIAQCVV